MTAILSDVPRLSVGIHGGIPQRSMTPFHTLSSIRFATTQRNPQTRVPQND